MAKTELVWTHRALHPLGTAGYRLVAPVAEKLQQLLRRPCRLPLALPSRDVRVIWGFVSRPNIFGIPERGGVRTGNSRKTRASKQISGERGGVGCR